MDHFNATVHNGTLVSTRKGLLISKSKHQGMRFVNAFASEPAAMSSPASSSKIASPEQNEVPGTGTGEASEAEQQKTADKSSSNSWFDVGGMTTPSPAVMAPTPASTASSNHHKNKNGQTPRVVEEPFTPMSNDDLGGIIAELRDEDHDDQVARTLLYASDQQPTESATDNANGQDKQNNSKAANSDNTPGPATVVVRRPAHNASTTRSAGEAANGQSTSHTETENPSRFLESVPAMTQRVVAQYLDNVPQESHLYEAIAVVASLAGEANTQGGEMAPTELAASIARVCATMNKDFLAGDDGGRVKLTAVLESVAALAIDGIFAGQQNHWHVLMKTVRDIVNRNGGMKIEWGNTLNKIRKADIKGAVYAGTSPYLEFDKFFPSIPEALPPQTRGDLATKLHRCLQPCNIHPANITSLQTLAFFAQTIIMARHALIAGSHVTIDPQGYAEDCLHVEYRLIKYPQALRSDVAESDRAFADLAAAAGQAADGSSNDSSGPAGIGGGGLGWRTPNLLNALVRVAAILYIEDLLPDARSVDLYSILLAVLTHQVRNIIIAVRQRSVDPQLNTSSAPSASAAITESLPSTDAARSVLIWACMIGHAISNFLLQTRPSVIVDRTAFEDCIALILTESNGLKTGDMELCEVLPTRELRAVNCDDNMLLRQIITGYETKQAWTAPR